jgi:hypothetical protein
MLRKLILFVGIAILGVQLSTTLAAADENSPAAPLVVIGSGTAASCQTNAARNLLSSSVEAGGTITFNCGAAPVTIAVNTNVTDKTVVIDGENRVSLSGEKLRQLFLVNGSGNLTLNNIILIDGKGFGGAAIAVTSSNAQVTINNSFLTGHDAEDNNGGAIFNVGALIINHSNLGANKSKKYGGAIFNNGGAVTITNSTIINNEASQGGGVFHAEGTLTIDRSAIRSNRAVGSGSSTGGGIHIDTGNGVIENSTFFDNRASAGAGAVYMKGSNLSITNATFNKNRADIGAALWNFAGQTTVKNTIFSGSRDYADTADSLNCDGPAATSAGRNIISDNTCVPNPGGMGDKFSTDPKLEASINDNGGPTRTFMLLADSPAIDYAQGCPATDQRGYPRPIGAGCDVGAVERGWLLFLPTLRK